MCRMCVFEVSLIILNWSISLVLCGLLCWMKVLVLVMVCMLGVGC